MGRYDPYLQALMQGQSQALQIRQNPSPSAASKFFEGLKAGRANLEARKESKLQEMLNQSLIKQREQKAMQEAEDRAYDIEQRPIKERGALADILFKENQAKMMGMPKPEAGAMTEYQQARLALEREKMNRPVGTGGPSNGLPGGGIRQIVPQEPGQPSIVVYRDGTTGYLEKPTGPTPNPLTTPRKEVPPSAKEAMVKNEVALKELEDGIKAVESNPQAFSAVNYYLPDKVTQRTDPKGIAARAFVAKIGAVKIHDMAGATQTVRELINLEPYLPKVGDTPGAISIKMNLLKKDVERLIQARSGLYSEDRFISGQGSGGAIPTFASPSDPGFSDLPSGAKFYDANGKLRTKK